MDVSDQVSPTSSASGFGCVTIDTMIATITPTTNAALAPDEAARLAGQGEHARADQDVDDHRRDRAGDQPVQPAVPVIRFQNRPRMKIANSGALKKLNSDWM